MGTHRDNKNNNCSYSNVSRIGIRMRRIVGLPLLAENPLCSLALFQRQNGHVYVHRGGHNGKSSQTLSNIHRAAYTQLANTRKPRGLMTTKLASCHRLSPSPLHALRHSSMFIYTKRKKGQKGNYEPKILFQRVLHQFL